MTTANDKGAATGEKSPVATAKSRAETGLLFMAAIAENPRDEDLYRRVAARYFNAAAEGLKGPHEP